MINADEIASGHADITIRNCLPEIDRLRTVDALLTGLKAPQRQISCMYFYDTVGSTIFEKITALPEYYLTRTEKPLIRQAAKQLAPCMTNLDILELGSGDCSKISLLFHGLSQAQLATLRYRPIDISLSAVEDSAKQLIAQFPGLTVDAIITDFVTQIGQLPASSRKRLYCFFGSTLGNLGQHQRERFFENLGTTMKKGDRLLLGVDMVKDRVVVEKAYNDASGLTVRFNRNILNVVNNIAKTDFDPKAYDHLAFYNEKWDRIEMHLLARRDQTITSPHLEDDMVIHRGEAIHTENSHKFTHEAVEKLARQAGLNMEACFTDSNHWFSLFQFVKHV
jgi:L-histidine N-alpha-methyltransferase